MRPISQKIRKIISTEPYYKFCARTNWGDCDGRITMEHAFIYSGRQINEIWAIIPLCEFHHSLGKYLDGGALDKKLNQYLALIRASQADLAKYPRVNWSLIFNNLQKYVYQRYSENFRPPVPGSTPRFSIRPADPKPSAI